ncbi:MAG: DJ-1/PfpI family protein [Treponema sp.]|jgi:4-methyl-5(b-hydroxyethyl)-thiazole monophosphate biosynthesis|nr:DJ-1/PfpI family protein [Treponema sp.]
MSKKAIVFFAEGFEEVEAITPIDYLRRAGIEVTTVSVGVTSSAANAVKGAHGIPVMADTSLTVLAGEGRLNGASWDAVLLPGGIPGAPNLAASGEVGQFLKDMAGAGKLVTAICASPAMVLFPLGLLKGRCFTGYPGTEKEVSGAQWTEGTVVIDGNIITSRGPGTAAAWAIAIIRKLLDEGAAKTIGAGVLLN